MNWSIAVSVGEQVRHSDRVIQALLDGSHAAFETVFHRFKNRLIRLVQARLDRRLRSKVDPDELLNSAFGSLYRGILEGAYQFKTWEQLWCLLTELVLNKCRRQAARFFSQSRDVTREVHMSDDRRPEQDRRDRRPLIELEDRNPNAFEVVAAWEIIELTLKMLSPNDRIYVAHFLNGYSTREIAEAAGCSQRRVQVAIKRARDILLDMRERGL